jgi:hypothetical protein
MLKKILQLLADANNDKRLASFVPRLQAAQKKLETATTGSDAIDSVEAEAKALLEEIEQTLTQTSPDLKQAAFNSISKLIGHTPVGTGAGVSLGGGDATLTGPGEKPKVAPKIQPLTKEEQQLEAKSKQITRTVVSDYDSRVSGFKGHNGAAVKRAEEAKAEFDHLQETLDSKKKDFDKLRLATQTAEKKIDSGEYGAAYKAYNDVLEEARLKSKELVELAKAAFNEVEEEKDKKGPADSLFDDFLAFRKRAKNLEAADAWRKEQNPDDPLAITALNALDKDIATLLKTPLTEKCKTPEDLLKEVEAKMTEAESLRKPDTEEQAATTAGQAAEVDKVVTEIERRILYCKDQLEGKAAQKAREELDKKYLDGDELKPDVIANDLQAIGKGSTAALKSTFDDLRYGRSSLTGAQIKKLYGEIIDKVLNNQAMLTDVSNDPELCGDLIMMAEKQGNLKADVLKSLGTKTSPVAQRVLLEKTKGPVGDGATSRWMWDAVELEDWNAKDKGIGAQVYNSLWNNGDYDQICKVIEKGVNPGQAHSLGQDTGRGSGKKEGIWSGFIQPMEHLLGNYVRKVHQLEEDPNAFSGDDLKKVQGAQKVLKALEGKSSILTDYKEIRDSKAMEAFNDKPGTIWGFEDVRLPYVQAAREKDKGNQPLRMWELWKAVEKALNQNGYDELLQNPDEAIKKFVEEGKKAVALEIKDSHAYPNLKLDEFLKEFELQATAYLKHVSEQIPKGQFDTAEISGMDPGKLMGGLGCKAGLWWAKESKPAKPVYYVIDGINLDEATDYKAWKNAKIKANLEQGGSKHFEVITFAEIREILKKWKDLKNTVVFIEKGNIVAESRVLEWREMMLEKDKDAGKRPAPPPERFKGKLEALGGDVWTKIQGEPYDAMKVTVKVDSLIRVAKMAKKDVLPKYLEQKCELLVRYKVLPQELAAAAKQVQEAKSDDKLRPAKVNFESLVRKTPPILQEPLLKWLGSVKIG